MHKTCIHLEPTAIQGAWGHQPCTYIHTYIHTQNMHTFRTNGYSRSLGASALYINTYIHTQNMHTFRTNGYSRSWGALALWRPLLVRKTRVWNTQCAQYALYSACSARAREILPWLSKCMHAAVLGSVCVCVFVSNLVAYVPWY
jgi:hypothetical protein